jgi:hypothetical protein
MAVKQIDVYHSIRRLFFSLNPKFHRSNSFLTRAIIFFLRHPKSNFSRTGRRTGGKPRGSKMFVFLINFSFPPSARWCMGSHLMASFQSQASVVKHVVALPTLLSIRYPVSFLGEYHLEGFSDLDIQIWFFEKISHIVSSRRYRTGGGRAEHPSKKMKLNAYDFMVCCLFFKICIARATSIRC